MRTLSLYKSIRESVRSDVEKNVWVCSKTGAAGAFFVPAALASEEGYGALIVDDGQGGATVADVADYFAAVAYEAQTGVGE